jgi:hypothetical protein
MTDAAVLRMLINRAVKDRGLDAPPKNSTPSPPVQEPTGSRGRGNALAKPGPRGSAVQTGPSLSVDAVAGAGARKKVGARTKRSEGTKKG